MNTTKQKLKPKQILSAYARSLRMTIESGPKLSAAMLVATVVAALAMPLEAWIAKLMIDTVTSALASNATVSFQTLLPVVIAFVVVWALGQVAESLSNNLRLQLSDQSMYHAQVRVIEKATRMDPACFESAQFYDQLSVARDQVWRISQVTYQMLDVTAQLISLVSLLLLLASIHWLVPILVVLTHVPKLIAQSVYTRKRASVWMNYTATRRMIDYAANVLGGREFVKETRLFQLEPHLLDKMRGGVRQFLSESMAIVVSQEKWNAVLSLLPLLSTAGVWFYVALEALARRRTVGDLALAFQALDSSRRAMNQIAGASAFLVENTFFVVQLFEYLDRPTESYPGALKRPQAGAMLHTPNMQGTLAFNNVSFRYPGADKNTLSNISFQLKAGERLALVGENGAGKTTLIKLLTRLYDPTEGTITCDGIDLRDMLPEAWQCKVGVIFQDFVRYDLTARDNIGFGDIDSYLKGALDGKLQLAAVQGGADAVIAELPKGYDTVLGRRFEGGTDLSGGQWQKIALARAFVRNADLLVLDEPTAALDAFAEAAVYNRFAELTEGKSTVFVTHRLSSVKMAQNILVLKDGALIEQGDHATLMAHSGEYAQMYTLQAERYA